MLLSGNWGQIVVTGKEFLRATDRLWDAGGLDHRWKSVIEKVVEPNPCRLDLQVFDSIDATYEGCEIPAQVVEAIIAMNVRNHRTKERPGCICPHCKKWRRSR